MSSPIAVVAAGLARILGVAFLGVASFACRSAAPDHMHAASVAPTTAPAREERNRDLHGPPEIASYIDSLEGPKRVADLQVPVVVAKLELVDGMTVADLGCGPGVFARAFGKALPHGVVYAVDVEPRQLDRLREHLVEDQLFNVVPVLASYTTPHLPPSSCDLIFIADTFHHFEDRVAYTRNLQRFLKPDGRLAILEYKPGDLPVGPRADHKLKPGELAAELESAGYERVAAFDTHAYHDFEVWRRAKTH